MSQTEGPNMTISLNAIKNAMLVFSFLFVGAGAYAEAKNDAQTIEEVTKFSDESSKIREDHIQSMRELHLKHVNELYDRKLSHNKEMTALWKQLKPGDKAANKALREQIKDKHKAFEKEDEDFKKEFKENVLKKKNTEFRESMKKRQQEMKKRFKD